MRLLNSKIMTEHYVLFRFTSLPLVKSKKKYDIFLGALAFYTVFK